ncbi:rRNA maturation RNase YbeY [Euzebyella saccharophila]|uniref:Endoribonuclease YbeY n=1 Tax=Euzebyella saccharophila TaxID=679664 RepID=A0ABV8JN54_9FLAO|nr:rRNA maturation RNase YbeY [Euzebyella saccharophila]
MIEFHFESIFELDTTKYSDWVSRIISSETKVVGPVTFIFCNDDYLWDINMKYLNHDTLTDIITFDYCEGNSISGDIFISIERVKENAHDFEVEFYSELKRVMAHGVLHLSGYKDKSDKDALVMRQKENEKIGMFHVEHSK